MTFFLLLYIEYVMKLVSRIVPTASPVSDDQGSKDEVYQEKISKKFGDNLIAVVMKPGC